MTKIKISDIQRNYRDFGFLKENFSNFYYCDDRFCFGCFTVRCFAKTGVEIENDRDYEEKIEFNKEGYDIREISFWDGEFHIQVVDVTPAGENNEK